MDMPDWWIGFACVSCLLFVPLTAILYVIWYKVEEFLKNWW